MEVEHHLQVWWIISNYGIVIYLAKKVYIITKVVFRRRRWHPTLVLLPGKSHGWRSLVDCSPWGCQESDTIEWLHFHFSLSCIGEGNVNPLQCTCLENPRDGGVWWAAVQGVAKNQTQLKRFSSSSNSSSKVVFIDLRFSCLI